MRPVCCASVVVVALTAVLLQAAVVESTYYCGKPPTLANGGHSGGNYWYYQAGTVISYWCYHGYTLQGSSQITCAYNSVTHGYEWGGSLPNCVGDSSDADDSGDSSDEDDSGDSSDSFYRYEESSDESSDHYGDSGDESSDHYGDSSDSSDRYHDSGDKSSDHYGDSSDSSDRYHDSGDKSSDHYGDSGDESSNSHGDSSDDSGPSCSHSGDSGESSDSSSSSSSDKGGLYCQCPALSSITNGYVRYHSRYPGAIAKYICNDGYTLEGKVFRKCLSSGYWTGSPPKCTRPTGCEKLISPKYGIVIYSSTEVGSYAKYFCKDGYYLVGVKFRKCEETGWTDEAPICKPILCDHLSKLEYGRIYLSRGYRLGSVATYRCNRGYWFEKDHGDVKRVCQEDGSWSGSPPLCTSNVCPSLPHPEDGCVKFTEGRSVGANVWYECNEGYVLEGSESRLCGNDLTWSGEAPQCVARNTECESPEKPDYGWVYYSYTTVGASCRYYCYRGYTLVGAESSVCTSSGTWEPEMPKCERYDDDEDD